MAAYYIDYDKDGKTVKTLKRGRPRRSYIEVKPDVWMRDPRTQSKVKQNTTEVNQKLPEVTSKISVRSDKRYPYNEIQKFIRSIRNETRGDTISMFCCDIVEEMPIIYLRGKKNFVRIDIVKENGDVLLWENAYRSGEPDIIIKSAVLM